MSHIEAFGAIRYTTSEVSNLIAPPYDVLSEADKKLLLSKDDHNIVAIDLPHVPPKSAGPDSAYEQAAGELTSWLDIRALARDPAPAIYVYHQVYKHVGRGLTRKMFFCRLRLEPFGSGSVFAHEETFGGPKEDRLKLTMATRCNLSPIFGLYPDPTNELSQLLDGEINREPDQSGVLEGIQNKLWVVTDDLAIERAQQTMSQRPIFIADGHHRYSTALMFRQHQAEHYLEPAPDDPINFVLAVLCSMEDPGALIQPYFRTIVDLPTLTSAKLRELTGETFQWTAIPKPASAEELARRFVDADSQSFALYFADEKACSILTPAKPDLLARLEPKRSPAWRGLAYAVFHRYLIDEVIRPALSSAAPVSLHYHKNMQEAIADAQAESGVAVLPPAVSMSQLKDVCMAGELMPQKSTYFHPKLATGLVINPLY